MDVITAVKTRISTRAFLDEAVPMSDIQEILDIARFSPSSSNLQPPKISKGHDCCHGRGEKGH